MSVLHRTDCVRCGTPLYHPPLSNGAMVPSPRELEFWGNRPTGSVYKLKEPEHYIIVSSDGLFVMATCRRYWELHKEFELLEKIVAGTRHKTEPPF
jgi:hypothetical protein